MPQNRRPLMEPWDVADVLSTSRKTVYKLAAMAELPAVRFGRTLRFDPADVENFIRSKRQAGPRPQPDKRPQRR